MDSNYEKGKKLLRGGYTQYTPDGRAQFIKAGAYGRFPKKGACQYNFISSKGRVGHIGVVIDCKIDYDHKKFTVWTVEGNTNSQEWQSNGGMVARKVYKDIPFGSVGTGNANHIDGFGYPDFGDDTCTADEFIDVLLRETGYIEKCNPKDNGDINKSATDYEKIANKGVNNYTKYGKWMKCNGVQWCAQFVSWAAWFACKTHSEKKRSGWSTDGQYWYYSINGEFVKNKWLFIDDRWYVFDGMGHMIKDWFLSENGWYYLNPNDGAMLSDQWLNYHGKWYYLSHSGSMVTNAYVTDDKGYCYVDNDGIWDGRYINNINPGDEVIIH